MTDFADSTIALPNEDDWHGWVDVLTRDDTGTIDCVPECLRQFVPPERIDSTGRLADPDMVPKTPYGIAKFMLMGHPLPWRGSGLRPEEIRPLLARGIEGWAILEALRQIDGAEPVEVQETPREVEPRPEIFTDLYMIRSEGGPIKIGISSDPQKRLKALQTAHPYKLEIVCIIPGGADLELEYHERFSEHRLHGEWFSPHPELEAEIERLNPTHPKEP